jgi:hypothetical protein
MRNRSSPPKTATSRAKSRVQRTPKSPHKTHARGNWDFAITCPKYSTSKLRDAAGRARPRPGHRDPMLETYRAGARDRARNGGPRTYTIGGARGGSAVPRIPGRVSSRGRGASRDLEPSAGEIGARLARGGGRWRRWWETRWWWKWGGRGRGDLKQNGD